METKVRKQSEYQQQRKKRVQRMKRNIIILLVVMLIVPTVTCIFLAVKVGSLQKQIDYLYEAKFGNGEMAPDENVPRLSDSAASNSIISVGASSMEGHFSDGSLTTNGQAARRKVYLTFDDGPSKYTEEIISILEKNDIKATFFVVGKTDESLVPLYKKIVDSGNTIALHSYTHQYSKIYNSVDDFKEDFKKIQDYVEELTGVKSKIYRFPGGSSNQVSNIDMAEFIKYFNSEGVVYFDWNAANGDATSKQYTVSELVNNVLNGISQKGDTVVLMHDTNAKGTTVDALPILIRELKKMDVDIVPLTETTKPVQHIKADSVK